MGVHASYQIDKDIRQLNPESLFEATMYWCLTKYLRYIHWPTLVIRVLNQQIASLKTDFDSSLELGVSVDRASIWLESYVQTALFRMFPKWCRLPIYWYDEVRQLASIQNQ